MALVYSSPSSFPTLSRSRRARRLAMVLASFMSRLPICLHTHPGQGHDDAHQQQQNQPKEQPKQEQHQPQFRPLPKRLIPIPIARRTNHTLVATHSVPRQPVVVNDTIQLTDLEFRIFTTLKSVLGYYNLKTQLRVAGGWVRDKLLGKVSGDIDIALDDMLGKTFCRKLMGYLRDLGIESNGFGVIRSNPMQAKHLEVARMEVFGVMIDFVNLRSAGYTENSSMLSELPEFGTPVEDAFRRDLTINSLFYNINSGMIEDPTGRGLSDLRAGIITTPLRAIETFMDDPLRILRALRFVATLDYELHPEAKEAINTDLKLALTMKISRHRIGAEIERIFGSNNPVKAMKILVETQLFPIVFKPPSELDIVYPDDIERRCLLALQSIVEVVDNFGSMKLSADHRKSLYFAAFLSPLRALEYQHKEKLMYVSTAIIKETLKLRSIDAAMVKTLHDTATSFSSIRKLLLKMDETPRQGAAELPSNTSELSFSYDKHKIERHLQEMRGLWRASMLLSVILEDEESLLHMSDEERKVELMRRSNACMYVEEAIVRQGLDKVKGTNHFFYKVGAIDHG